MTGVLVVSDMTETTQAAGTPEALTRFFLRVAGIKAELARRLDSDDEATRHYAYAWAAGSYEGAMLTLRAEVRG